MKNECWISIGLVLGTVFCLLIVLTMHLRVKEDEKRLMRFPIVMLNGVLVALSIVFSIVVAIMNKTIAFRIVIITQCVLLLVQIIVTIVNTRAQKTLIENANVRKKDVFFIRGLVIELDMLITKCQNEQLVKKLSSLKGVVEYSDPRSTALVAAHDENIMMLMDALKKCVAEADINDALELCCKMEEIFFERNKILLATK